MTADAFRAYFEMVTVSLTVPGDVITAVLKQLRAGDGDNEDDNRSGCQLPGNGTSSPVLPRHCHGC